MKIVKKRRKVNNIRRVPIMMTMMVIIVIRTRMITVAAYTMTN